MLLKKWLSLKDKELIYKLILTSNINKSDIKNIFNEILSIIYFSSGFGPALAIWDGMSGYFAVKFSSNIFASLLACSS